MKRWPIKPLGELVLPTEQRDPRENPILEFSYVDIAGVDNEAKVIVATKKIVGADAPSRARKVIRKGDVIISTVRPNLNAVALVPDALDNQICSTGFSVLRPSERVLSGYLFAFARSPFFIESLVARTTGANYPAVNDGEVKAVPVPVPPLAEQERIVKLLDEADELRKLRTHADHRTADLIPALFHEMFGVPAANPYSWPVRRLEEVVATGKIVTYGIVQAGPNVPDGIPYIRTGDLKDGIIKTDGLLRTSHEIAASYRRSEVSAGDIVMSIRATVGTTAIVPQELHGANLTQGTARISPGTDLVNDFLLWFLRMPQTQSWIQGQVKGATFREITLGNLRQLPVLTPPIPLQNKFAQRVTEIRELEADQATSRTRLDALFQSMLHRAFNGEL